LQLESKDLARRELTLDELDGVNGGSQLTDALGLPSSMGPMLDRIVATQGMAGLFNFLDQMDGSSGTSGMSGH
jgi:hypothetical protein